MSETKEKDDPLNEKISKLTNLFDIENVDEMSSFFENNLTAKDILSMRFTSSQKSLLIKLVILESNQFPNLFDIIKKKLSKEELISF